MSYDYRIERDRTARGCWWTRLDDEGAEVGPAEWVPDSAARWRPEAPAAYRIARSVLLTAVLFLIALGLLTGLEAKAEPITPAAAPGGWSISIIFDPFGWPMIWVRNIDAGSEG